MNRHVGGATTVGLRSAAGGCQSAPLLWHRLRRRQTPWRGDAGRGPDAPPLPEAAVLTLLLLASALVSGADMDDAVSVDVEGDLDLWDAAGGRGDADQLELAEEFVVGGHLTLALEDLDLHLGLTVGSGREHLQTDRHTRSDEGLTLWEGGTIWVAAMANGSFVRNRWMGAA